MMGAEPVVVKGSVLDINAEETWAVNRAWTLLLAFINIFTQRWIACLDFISMIAKTLITDFFVDANVRTSVRILAFVDVA